jgi:hypothetical protein
MFTTLFCQNKLYNFDIYIQHNGILTVVSYYTTDATGGAGTAYPSGAPEFTPCFYWGSCYAIFSYMSMFVDRCLFLNTFFLLAIVLSVLRYTDSDYPLWYLQTLLT